MLISLSDGFHLRGQPQQRFSQRSQGRVSVRRQSQPPRRNLLLSSNRNRFLRYRPRSPYYLPRTNSGPNIYERRLTNFNKQRPIMSKVSRRRQKIPQTKETQNKNRPSANMFTRNRNPDKPTLVSANDLRKLSNYVGRSRKKVGSQETKNKQVKISQTVTNVFKPSRIPIRDVNEKHLVDFNLETPFSPVSTTPSSFTKDAIPPKVTKNTHDRSLDKFETAKILSSKEASSVIGSKKSSLNFEQVRDKLRDIVLISDENLRQDSMKELVRGIVSESGILLKNQTAVNNVGIATLDNILEMIQSISNKLQEQSDSTTQSRENVLHNIQNLNPPNRDRTKQTAKGVHMILGPNSEAPSHVQNRQEHLGSITERKPLKQENPLSFGNLAGFSIFGDPPESRGGIRGSSTTADNTLPGNIFLFNYVHYCTFCQHCL